MSDWLIFLIVLAVVGLIVRREWRAHQIDLPAPATGDFVVKTDRGGEPDSDDQPASADDQWVDQLHAINQATVVHPLVKRSLTRPVDALTHYEVEAVIRQLGVPDWLPGRVRVAA